MGLRAVTRNKKRAPVSVTRIRDRWILRVRVQTWKDGVERTVQRAIPIADCEGRGKTPPAAILKLAAKEVERLKGEKAEPVPLMQMRVGEFYTTVFLPWVTREKKPSTTSGYQGLWARHVVGSDFESL